MSAEIPRAKSAGPQLVRGASFNALVGAIGQLGGGQPPPGVLKADGSGRIPPGTPIWAKITGGGTGGAYSWAQVTRQGAAWVETGVTGSDSLDPATEANGLADVDVGRRVRLTRFRGQWVFAVPECFHCRVPILVRKCDGTPVPDATVTIGEVTRTTNAEGKATLSVPEAGTYTVTVSKSPYPTYEREHEITCDETLEIRMGDQKLKLVVGLSGCGDRFGNQLVTTGFTLTVERGTYLVGAEDASWAPDDGGCSMTVITDHSCEEFDLNRPGCGPSMIVGAVEETGQPIWRGYRVTVSKDRFRTLHLYSLVFCGEGHDCQGGS